MFWYISPPHGIDASVSWLRPIVLSYFYVNLQLHALCEHFNLHEKKVPVHVPYLNSCLMSIVRPM